ncbi:MAG TPA: hypothetical protein VGR54_03800 [Nitrosopumilaceae archaeon]|nr:hypothetical protein [Nitrosopumilaceae archaeon]
MTKSKLLIPFGIAIFAVAGLLLNSGGFAPVSQANTLSASPSMLGHVELIAKDSNGNIKAYRQTDNVVVQNGKMCTLVNTFGVPTNGTQNTACGGVTTNKFTQVAIGTGTAGELLADNALTTPTGGRATNGTYSFINSTLASPYYSIQTTFHPGLSGTTTIAEAGIFDAASGGHMFAHKTFTGIGLQSTDTLTVTWRVSLS